MNIPSTACSAVVALAEKRPGSNDLDLGKCTFPAEATLCLHGDARLNLLLAHTWDLGWNRRRHVRCPPFKFCRSLSYNASKNSDSATWFGWQLKLSFWPPWSNRTYYRQLMLPSSAQVTFPPQSRTLVSSTLVELTAWGALAQYAGSQFSSTVVYLPVQLLYSCNSWRDISVSNRKKIESTCCWNVVKAFSSGVLFSIPCFHISCELDGRVTNNFIFLLWIYTIICGFPFYSGKNFNLKPRSNLDKHCIEVLEQLRLQGQSSCDPTLMKQKTKHGVSLCCLPHKRKFGS